MKKAIYRILMLICLAVFLFSGWKLYEIWQGGQQIKNETGQLESYLKPSGTGNDSAGSQDSAVSSFEPDWAGLKAQNPDIIGWIIIPGTGISYPIVQGSDNSYYLNVTALGEYNRRGAIFLDADSSPDLTDDNSIIYGHSVDVGGMFTNLKDFESREFFDSHPYYWILTPEGNYRVEITGITKGDSTYAVYTTSFGDYRDSVVQTIQDQALYWRDVSNPEGYPFVSLSTCDLDYGFSSEQRLILTGILTPWNEPVPDEQ